MYIKRYDEHHTYKERKELKKKLREEEIKRFEEDYDDFEDGFNI
ncbi:MAG: hypothetical protein ACXACC_04495 [Promethearchaeota archaeon]|jgi:hypothetical protein